MDAALISLQPVLARAILVAVFMFLPDGQRRDLIKKNLGKMGLRDKKVRSCTVL